MFSFDTVMYIIESSTWNENSSNVKTLHLKN